MRDTLRYPITHEEKLDYLSKLYEENLYEKTGRIGDLTPSIIKLIYEDVINCHMGKCHD